MDTGSSWWAIAAFSLCSLSLNRSEGEARHQLHRELAQGLRADILPRGLGLFQHSLGNSQLPVTPRPPQAPTFMSVHTCFLFHFFALYSFPPPSALASFRVQMTIYLCGPVCVVYAFTCVFHEVRSGCQVFPSSTRYLCLEVGSFHRILPFWLDWLRAPRILPSSTLTPSAGIVDAPLWLPFM